VRIPKLEEIIKFSSSFLLSVTKEARDTHLGIIEEKYTNPDGRRFKELVDKDYIKLKKREYGHTKPNLKASGLLFSQIQAKPPRKSRSKTVLKYGIRSGAVHPRNKGSISSATLMGYHQDGAGLNKKRDIAGEKVLHNDTIDEIAPMFVNQIRKNIERALRPGRTDLTL
tara:strand:+ start:483 stop:989 length:507 start_codon:yes stop_codon:yes gene_type:complete